MVQTSSAVERVSYDDLYQRWERGNWSATELDFTQDRVEWHERFSELERRAALWNYSLFFHGEDSVTDNLSPFIDAAPQEEQKYFLVTQQVDEARHAVFFARFIREVVERGDTIAGSLSATDRELTWGFRRTFELLDKVANDLRRDRSRPMLAAAITMYHLVVEATLAQTGQHFIESYLEGRELLPGFRAGMQNVSLDEQRHIGFGVKLLADLNREDPDCRYAVADILREALPYAAAVFVPPGWDRRYVECFDSTIEDLYFQGIQSLSTKLRSAGLPLDELPGPSVIPLDVSSRRQAERIIGLLEANVIGEKSAPPATDHETLATLFEMIGNSVDKRHAPGRPLTIQWEFEDAPAWHLRIDNGATTAAEGRAAHTDLVLRTRFEDWADIVARREDPRLAILKRKLRPRGSLLTLWRMQKIFAR